LQYNRNNNQGGRDLDEALQDDSEEDEFLDFELSVGVSEEKV